MFSLNSKEITVNLLEVISVHCNGKVSNSLLLTEHFFVPPSQKEYAICSNVHAVRVGQQAVKSWGRELSIFICSLVR